MAADAARRLPWKSISSPLFFIAILQNSRASYTPLLVTLVMSSIKHFILNITPHAKPMNISAYKPMYQRPGGLLSPLQFALGAVWVWIWYPWQAMRAYGHTVAIVFRYAEQVVSFCSDKDWANAVECAFRNRSRKEYLVHCDGFGPEHYTYEYPQAWGPEAKLSDCFDKLSEYWLYRSER